MAHSYAEIILTEQSDSSLFIRLADRIVSEYKATIIKKLNGLDEVYWDFLVESEIITLHQQTYIGISIFPKDLERSTAKANRLAEKIAATLKKSGLI